MIVVQITHSYQSINHDSKVTDLIGMKNYQFYWYTCPEKEAGSFPSQTLYLCDDII